MKAKTYKTKVAGSNAKVIIGFVIIALAFAGLYVWETIGEKALTYTEVIVLNQNVAEHQTIKESMVTTLEVPNDEVIDGALQDAKEIIGKESQNYIPKGAMLVKEYFETTQFSLGKGEYVFPIPDEWIYQTPQTIRRGDTIYLCPTTGENGNVKNCVSATVYFVKDSANREIQDTSKEPRYDASGVVSNIEIIIDNERYEKLFTAHQSGAEFIILYN